ncbi:hypothetical protein [Haloferax volcanii]|uniref:hypothetical protein n=1 Tax=Haloferax volcanii TaxID=2246 RepID=UPI003854DF18
MAGNVFLVPCDPGNFRETVLTHVELDDYPDHPAALSNLESVRFWGARDGESNRNYFEKMESDDLVLFYQDGQYVGVGFVGLTFEDSSDWASTTFWRNAPSNLIYTITEFDEVAVPRAAVNRIFGYDDEYYPQGLMRVASGRVSRRPVVIKRAVTEFDAKNSPRQDT